jgi:hypothetical protein
MRPTFNSKVQRSCRGQKHPYKAQMPTSTCRPSQAKSPWILSPSLILVALREVLKRSISFCFVRPSNFRKAAKAVQNCHVGRFGRFPLAHQKQISHTNSRSSNHLPGTATHICRSSRFLLAKRPKLYLAHSLERMQSLILTTPNCRAAEHFLFRCLGDQYFGICTSPNADIPTTIHGGLNHYIRESLATISVILQRMSIP